MPLRGSWKPGSRRRPSVDEAQAYDDWVRARPETRQPVHPRSTYQQMGWQTGSSPHPGERELSETLEPAQRVRSGWEEPGVAAPEFERLPQWSDVPERRVTTQEARQSGGKLAPTGNLTTRDVAARKAGEQGVNVRHMNRRAGQLLDDAMSRSHKAGTPIPEGRDFYSQRERGKIGEAARRQDVSFESMASATAASSPQVPWTRKGRDLNIEIAEDIAEHSRAGRPGLPQTETGLPDMMQKSRQILENPGTRARDVVPGGPKVQSFEQNFLNPGHPEGRATVDRHMVQALTGLPEDRAEGFLGGGGGVKANYLMVDQAIRDAASQRGVSVDEAQSIIWHQQKRRNELGETGRTVHGQTMAREAATQAQERQLHGQTDFTGSRVEVPAESRARAQARQNEVYVPQSQKLNEDQFRPL